MASRRRLATWAVGAARRINCRRAMLRAMLLVVVFPSYSTAAVLFDGQLATPPDSQGWSFITSPLSGALATEAPSVGWTTLDTRGRRSDSAGYLSYGHPDIGVLDRSLGFTLSIDLKLIDETHVSANRAGFSVLVVTNDLKAIELGFWQNQIWAQNDSPLFTHGESATFLTTSGFVHYDLTVAGSAYALKASGVPILTGSLRDYSAFGQPYSAPNLVFLGDNTSSASAAAQIARVELTNVPEPASWSLLALAIGISVPVSVRQRTFGVIPLQSD
jgi:hypothetical protein